MQDLIPIISSPDSVKARESRALQTLRDTLNGPRSGEALGVRGFPALCPPFCATGGGDFKMFELRLNPGIYFCMSPLGLGFEPDLPDFRGALAFRRGLS
jgi:hypothetical protein